VSDPIWLILGSGRFWQAECISFRPNKILYTKMSASWWPELVIATEMDCATTGPLLLLRMFVLDVLRCLQWDTPQNSTGFTPFELLCESEVHNYLPIFHGLMIVKTLHYLFLPLLWRLSTLENQMQCTRIWSQLGNQIQCARILCARGWKPAKENVKLRHTKNLFVKSSETLARST